jgi:hypothetical protein
MTSQMPANVTFGDQSMTVNGLDSKARLHLGDAALAHLDRDDDMAPGGF